MQAIELKGPGQLELVDREMPESDGKGVWDKSHCLRDLRLGYPFLETWCRY